MFKDKKKRKKIIIITILIVVVLALILTNIFGNKEEEIPNFDTADIETKTLTTSISSTGKIATENSKTVTSQLVNYKVTGVNVKVGDKVNVGDVLCTFDTANLAKNVSDLSATINAGNVTGSVTVASAERAVQDADRSRNSALDPLRQQTDLARQDFQNHEAALNTARANLQSNQDQVKSLEAQIPALTASINAAKVERDAASTVYTQKENEYNTAKVALDAAKADPNQLSILTGLETALTGAAQLKETARNELSVKENTLAGEQNKLNEVTGKINELNTQIAQLNQSIPAQEQVVNQKRDIYTTTQKKYDDTSASLNNQVANAQGQLESAKAQTSVSNLTVQEQLNVYQKQLEETNLKSTVAGTVTSVVAKAGDYYAGGALLTIEGVESFIVETEIDEYDIADIKEGMEVVIKTDATRDEELAGKVISVAPASTANAATSAMTGMGTATTGSSSATYTVKIELTTPNDRLRLGMNAKLSIITNKSENVLAVPYDAITEKEDGTKSVTIIKDDNSEEEINVTTRLESGYYTEISSDKLKAGMKVKLPKIDGSSSVDELLNSMGATAGM
ncbi:MAG: efflux RND transporter periplasmic adaptor subunit [Clostridia bacterium]